MERTSRREALGTLGGLLAALALAPLAVAPASADPVPAMDPAWEESRAGAPAVRPPRHAVRRHG
jgi:hypothetical protein